MRRTKSAALFLAAALCTGGCQLGDDAGRETDLVLRNAGTTALARIAVNGVDQGPLPAGGVMTLEDVGPGSFLVQAYVNVGDARPCATHETAVLQRGQTAEHSFDCSR